MPRFNVAFWNVYNLFEPLVFEPKSKRALSESEYWQKIRGIGQVLSQMVEDGPDLIGLSEVGSKKVVQDIANQLGFSYWVDFIGGSRASSGGLGVIGKTTVVVKRGKLQGRYPRNMNLRPHWVFNQYLVGSKVPFVYAIVHLPSDFRGNAQFDRIESTRVLRDDLRSANSLGIPILVLGDFNSEPHSIELGEIGLRSYREFEPVLNKSEEVRLYNASWRHMPESSMIEEYRNRRNVEDSESANDRPNKTWSSLTADHGLFDQTLVSRACLEGPLIFFLESESGPFWRHDKISSYDAATGSIVIAHPKSKSEGLSDHLPVIVKFKY